LALKGQKLAARNERSVPESNYHWHYRNECGSGVGPRLCRYNDTFYTRERCTRRYQYLFSYMDYDTQFHIVGFDNWVKANYKRRSWIKIGALKMQLFRIFPYLLNICKIELLISKVV